MTNEKTAMEIWEERLNAATCDEEYDSIMLEMPEVDDFTMSEELDECSNCGQLVITDSPFTICDKCLGLRHA